jgi:hypothetical protein
MEGQQRNAMPWIHQSTEISFFYKGANKTRTTTTTTNNNQQTKQTNTHTHTQPPTPPKQNNPSPEPAQDRSAYAAGPLTEERVLEQLRA